MIVKLPVHKTCIRISNYLSPKTVGYSNTMPKKECFMQISLNDRWSISTSSDKALSDSLGCGEDKIKFNAMLSNTKQKYNITCHSSLFIYGNDQQERGRLPSAEPKLR